MLYYSIQGFENVCEDGDWQVNFIQETSEQEGKQIDSVSRLIPLNSPKMPLFSEFQFQFRFVDLTLET